jgi:hypothetical protein
MEYKTKKLLKGIALTTTYYLSNDFIGGADGLNQIEKHIYGFLSFLYSDLAHLISGIIVIAIGITMLYCFVSGLFRIGTYHLYIPEFESKD